MAKKCSKCGVQKDASYFTKSSRNKDGLYSSCKSCRSSYRKANKEAINNKNKEWWKSWYSDKDNRKLYLEGRKEDKKKYYDENTDKVKDAWQKWYSDNKENQLERNARRRFAVLQQTPTWLSNQEIDLMRNIYKNCRLLNESEGYIKYHVDHIIPLQGQECRGLHVPWNLRIITAVENLRKRNKVEAIDG